MSNARRMAGAGRWRSGAGRLPGGAPAAFAVADYDLHAWFDGSNVLTGAGGITQFTDRSGNENHATPPAEANRPAVDSINGVAAALFNGTSDYATFGAFGTGSDHEFTAYFVAVGSTLARYLMGGDGASNRSGVLNDFAGDNYIQIFAGAVVDSLVAPADATPFKVAALFGASSGAIYVDDFDAAAVSGDPGGQRPASVFGLGARGYSQAGTYWVGKIGEVILVNGLHSQPTVRLFGDYLNARWGLSG